MKCNLADLVQHKYSWNISHFNLMKLFSVLQVLPRVCYHRLLKCPVPGLLRAAVLPDRWSITTVSFKMDSTRRSAAEGCFGETGSDAEGSSRVQQWPLSTFLKGKCTKLCGLKQPNNMLQMCFNKFRLLLSLQQFFSYRKPPKGYYIYGDVGKFMLWLSQMCLSCYWNKLLSSVINAYFLVLSGTGKTMVMDMFYDHVETVKKKGSIFTDSCWMYIDVSLWFWVIIVRFEQAAVITHYCCLCTDTF